MKRKKTNLKKWLGLFCMALLAMQAVAQNQTVNWIFGRGSQLQFSNSTGAWVASAPASSPVPASFNTSEGCSVVSGCDGGLLFYTNGRRIFKNDNTALKDNNNIDILLNGHPSSTSSSVVIPSPDRANIYYVFTADATRSVDSLWTYSNYSTIYNLGEADTIKGAHKGIQFTEIYVDPVTKTPSISNNRLNQQVFGGYLNNVPSITGFSNVHASEKIAVVKHDNGKDFWLIVHAHTPLKPSNAFSDSYYVVPINSTTIPGTGQNTVFNAINPSYIQHVGEKSYNPDYSAGNSTNNNSAMGYLKPSPSGNYLAAAYHFTANNNGSGIIEILGFNDSTGVISSLTNAPKFNNLSNAGTKTACKYAYGLEWSSDGNILYGSWMSYNSSNGSVIMAYKPDGTVSANSIGSLSNYDVGALQMGLDGRIYVACHNKTYLSDIRSSNSWTNSSFNENSINLSNFSHLGLPTFVQTYVVDFAQFSINKTNDQCGNTYTFSPMSNEDFASISYSWNFGDPSSGVNNISTSENPTHSYWQNGTYTVTLTVEGILKGANECTFRRTYNTTVIVQNQCCQLNNSAAFTFITQNTTIGSNTIWNGKYYIANNVTVTVNNNAILDITNCDIVFGTCAGINFETGTTIRANNSVFRPCDMNNVWNGVRFNHATSGTINECTFKNAKYGLFFSGTVPDQGTTIVDATNIRVTSNLFLNCNNGIRTESINFNESISDNHFVVDDSNLDYASSVCDNNPSFTAVNNIYYGIYNASTNHTGTISANNFIYTDKKSSSTRQFTGIYAANIDATISNNSFTDVYCAIKLNRTRTFVSLENNFVEITKNNNNYMHQISIMPSTSNCQIYGNVFKNMKTTFTTNDFTLTNTRASIYVDKGTNISIRSNEINGGVDGIFALGSSNVTIVDNNIKNVRDVAIWVNSFATYGSNYDISCNYINMSMKAASSGYEGTGILYSCSVTGNRGVKIRSNCIFETNTAIWLSGTGSLMNLPSVTNNYLSNYRTNGILNQGLNGSIGSGTSSYSVAARNTFNSNNAGSTTCTDINSTVAITVYGNYGVNSVSSNVTQYGNNSWHSTASCGNTLASGQAATINQEEVCEDVYYYANQRIANFNSIPEILAALSDAPYDLRKPLTEIVLMNNADNVSFSVEVLNKIKEGGILNAEDFAFESFNFNFSKGFFQKAKNDLNMIGNFNSDFVIVGNVMVNEEINNHIDLTDAQVSELASLAMNQNSLFNDEASSILERKTGKQYNYKHYELQLPENNSRKVLNGIKLLNVFPNPTNGLLNIEVENNTNSEVVFNVYSVTGKLAKQINAKDINSGITIVDLSDLLAGLYFVDLVITNERVASAKVSIIK